MVKIGLEIHGYLITKEKLFCRCKAIRHSAKLDIKENTNICPVCTGTPGCKPMLPNEEAVKKAVKIGLMLNCKINNKIIWQRKHYGWPDLPKGYQNTISGAYSVPNCENGKFGGIRIREIHLEEDPAAWNPETGCIDYNRSGLPLVEIVTEPDFKSSEEVVLWLEKLILNLSYIKALDKNAGIKADVNVSTGGERVEIKNINSLDSIRKAIEYEIKRQGKEKVERETRRFDGEKTIRMRGKENLEDYRFIPEPDLPGLFIPSDLVEEIKKDMPESPDKKLERLIKKHKINSQDAEVLYRDFNLVKFFEETIKEIDAGFALPWVVIELNRVLNYNKKTLEEVDIRVEHFTELLKLVKEGKITELKGKQILNSFIPKSFKPSSKGEEVIKDKGEIEGIVDEVLSKNSKAVEDYNLGKQEALNFLVGEVMRASNKRADFKSSREIILKKLKA